MSPTMLAFGGGLFLGCTFGFILAAGLAEAVRKAHADDAVEAAIREDMDRVDRESREIAAEWRRRREAMRMQSLNRRGA